MNRCPRCARDTSWEVYTNDAGICGECIEAQRDELLAAAKKIIAVYEQWEPTGKAGSLPVSIAPMLEALRTAIADVEGEPRCIA